MVKNVPSAPNDGKGMSALGKNVKTDCKVGLPPNEIVALASKESVNLIVMEPHGRTCIKHLVMGSIARSVLRTGHRQALIEEAPAIKGDPSEAPYEFPIP